MNREKASNYRGSPADWIVEKAIAHRGLHDAQAGIPENSLASARRAVAAGYNIEVDLQWAGDGEPVVFHDSTLPRMTGNQGGIRDFTSRELAGLTLSGTRETIPSLAEFLDVVRGRVGVVLELKGLSGEDAGYAKSVAKHVEGYAGNLAVMSFHHWLLRDFAEMDLAVPLGLTAEGDDGLHEVHSQIDEEIGFDFLSYRYRDLGCRFVADFRTSGRPVICWTIRNANEARQALQYCDQITFEGFSP